MLLRRLQTVSFYIFSSAFESASSSSSVAQQRYKRVNKYLPMFVTKRERF